MILSQLKKIKRKIKLILINFEYKGLSTEQIFSKIYKDGSWDKKALNFNSGPGSHNEKLVLPYVKFVSSFLIDKKLKSIIDLGCGDFNVGKDIYKYVHKYYAYDIVPDFPETAVLGARTFALIGFWGVGAPAAPRPPFTWGGLLPPTAPNICW